jgi:hypothetical protein
MTEATINLVALCFLTKFEIKMARQKNISNSKPIEKVDGVYDSLMELDRDIKVEKEKNLKIKQSPIRQSLIAAEKSNFQDGGKTKLLEEEEKEFQKFYSTLPENLQSDDPTYDIRGYWNSEGRPVEFDYSQPKEDDGYYHAYSVNQNTGEYLKSPAHPTFQHAVEEDKKMGYRPAFNIHTGKWGSEEVAPEYQDGGTKTFKSEDGTITNTVENSDGSKTVQVKTKDGKYFETKMPKAKDDSEDSLAEDIVELVDPTGISSWDDVKRAYDENGLFNPKTALEILGALPLIGKVGKSGKILAGGEKLFLDSVKYFGYNDKVAKAYNAYRKIGGKNLDDALGLTTKGLVNTFPKLNPNKWASSENVINSLNKASEVAKSSKLFPYTPSGDTSYQDGGVSSLEGDLISKVVMERNKDKDFVQRAYALGKNPGTSMFNAFEPDEFGQTMSHKMAWGEDDKGQAYMFPTVMNPKNEAVKVPNQYADYISNEGYKRATGMLDYQDGGIIVDSEGQYSHPGKNTLIPNADGRITMKDVKTPVLGIDDRGNSTVMQPEEEYQFQGNSVLEIPITGDIDSLVDPTRIKAFKKLFSK